MTNKEIVEKLKELKEFANDMNVSIDAITEKIDDIIYDINGKDIHKIDDPFEVDDELDEFLNNNDNSFNF